MEGNLKRDYDFSIIVTADNIKSLSDMVSKDFKEVRYEIKTEDGATYSTEYLNEILEYNNPDSRRIQMFKICGNKENTGSFFSPNLSVTLFDSSIYDKSCILHLNNVEEKDIIYYTNAIDEYVNQIKASYWWIFKERFYWVTGILIYIIFSSIYLTNVNNTDIVNKIYNSLLLQSASAICMVFSMIVFHKIVSYFYPESCFAIGEQEKHKAKKEKIRNLIFGTILGALIIGVVSSIIAYYFIDFFTTDKI